MGDTDKWSTPKQIKIERAGEPTGIRRGILKKGERKRGKKARIDQILSAQKDVRFYADFISKDAKSRQEHPEWYDTIVMDGRKYRRYDPSYQKWYDESYQKLIKLIAKCVKDGVLTLEESKQYLIGGA